ncbi:MAG: hypothetical protein EXR70_24110 [Deltaproteobacteria bacterium]|nr:hypothetical protein [Deltaproteobacteria bacterium]
MKNLRSSIILAALFSLLGFAARVNAQDALAVITELKFNRGDIQLRASSGAAPAKPAVLQSLYAGNVIQTKGDVVAVVFFTDGSGTISVDEKNPNFEIKAGQSKGSAAGSKVREVAGLLLGKKKPPTYVALSVRGKPQAPTLLSPRNTKLTSDAPTFQWMGMDQQPGSVKVFGPQGVIWSADNINLTKIAYPASAPRLQPEVEYSWVIEKKGFAVTRVPFKLLRSADADEVKNRLAELSSVSAASKTTFAVLKANLLMSKELFHDAREVLSEAIAADNDEPTLHFVLAELYDKIGLKNLAGEEYNEAEFLSKAKR